MPEPIEVILLWHESLMAATIGVARHLAALNKKCPDQHGCDPTMGWQVHIEGACGEAAVAKALNRHWCGSVNTFKLGGDVGTVQVRTRSKDWYELIVRNSDREGDVFILVTGNCPKYTIRGWISGVDAKKPEWLKSHGDREPAWFVPQDRLRPLSELNW